MEKKSPAERLAKATEMVQTCPKCEGVLQVELNPAGVVRDSEVQEDGTLLIKDFQLRGVSLDSFTCTSCGDRYSVRVIQERVQGVVEEGEKCEHDPCFSNYVLTSDPPKHPWICRKCGAEGVEIGKAQDLSEYGRLRHQFGKDDQTEKDEKDQTKPEV